MSCEESARALLNTGHQCLLIGEGAAARFVSDLLDLLHEPEGTHALGWNTDAACGGGIPAQEPTLVTPAAAFSCAIVNRLRSVSPSAAIRSGPPASRSITHSTTAISAPSVRS